MDYPCDSFHVVSVRKFYLFILFLLILINSIIIILHKTGFSLRIQLVSLKQFHLLVAGRQAIYSYNGTYQFALLQLIAVDLKPLGTNFSNVFDRFSPNML